MPSKPIANPCLFHLLLLNGRLQLGWNMPKTSCIFALLYCLTLLCYINMIPSPILCTLKSYFEEIVESFANNPNNTSKPCVIQFCSILILNSPLSYLFNLSKCTLTFFNLLSSFSFVFNINNFFVHYLLFQYYQGLVWCDHIWTRIIH